jgi:hypothetical protein
MQALVAADPELLELAQRDFATYRKEAEINLESLIAIKRPTRPVEEETSETQPEEESDLNLTARRGLAKRASSDLARLIENPQEAWLPHSVARAVDAAQVVMNDLYRAGAKYGDGSTAFIVMLEQFRAGVGKESIPIVGKTRHEVKARGYIKGFRRIMRELPAPLKPQFPKEAIERIEAEIKKLEEALEWAENYRNGDKPKIPKLAKDWKDELEQ